MSENLIEKITRLIMTDDANGDKESNRIIQTYQNANDVQKALIDDIFISLCGFSLNTLTSEDCDV